MRISVLGTIGNRKMHKAKLFLAERWTKYTYDYNTPIFTRRMGEGRGTFRGKGNQFPLEVQERLRGRGTI